MRLATAYDGYHYSRLTQSEAAVLLGVCERTFWRYIDRYHDQGLDGFCWIAHAPGIPQSPG